MTRFGGRTRKGTMVSIPLFAFVGPVNPGKTSVIATLTEQDALRISRIPGETTECQYFDVFVEGKSVLRLCDTPGFQNPKETLAILKQLTHENAEPLQAFRRFVELYSGDPNFQEECKLLKPILNGAGIAYVVDASRKVLSANEAEMEILQMTGQPRLGIINSTDEPIYLQEWKNRLSVHFNVKLEFNAHTATFRERIDLIESLSLIEQEWRVPIHAAAEALQRDLAQRIHAAAETIADLLVKALQHHEASNFVAANMEEEQEKVAIAHYQEAIRTIEAKAHRQLVALFRHQRLEVADSISAFMELDLFSEKAWQAFGLTWAQLILAGATAGAAGGALVDGFLLGHGFGVPTLVGTTVGAVTAGLGAVAGGAQLTRVKLPLAQQLQQLMKWNGALGGVQIRVGPNRNPQFSWILLDRALAIYFVASHRAHARQDREPLNADDVLVRLEGEGVLSKTWNGDIRRRCERAFASIRKGKAKHEVLQELVKEIENRLMDLSR